MVAIHFGMATGREQVSSAASCQASGGMNTPKTSCVRWLGESEQQPGLYPGASRDITHSGQGSPMAFKGSSVFWVLTVHFQCVCGYKESSLLFSGSREFRLKRLGSHYHSCLT
ncbi:hypothetical protein TNCV_204191 [Trichonephila clavipes]|nr:hypothetical protein TNCV_204191 [Trichonephila clavipes]